MRRKEEGTKAGKTWHDVGLPANDSFGIHRSSPPSLSDLLSIMSLKGMTKKEQQQVLLSCGLDHSLPPSAPEPTASFPPSSLPSSFGTSHAAYPAVGASLDAAKQVAGKGLKVMSEEMRRAFKG